MKPLPLMTEMIRIKRGDEWKGEDSVCARFKKCALASEVTLPESSAEIFG